MWAITIKSVFWNRRSTKLHFRILSRYCVTVVRYVRPVEIFPEFNRPIDFGREFRDRYSLIITRLVFLYLLCNNTRERPMYLDVARGATRALVFTASLPHLGSRSVTDFNYFIYTHATWLRDSDARNHDCALWLPIISVRRVDCN